MMEPIGFRIAAASARGRFEASEAKRASTITATPGPTDDGSRGTS
jgi:hypothetical protein